MLITRNSQSTGWKDVLYWDNGREKYHIPAGEQVQYLQKEIARLNQASNYQSSKDQQLIDELKEDNETLRAMLILTDHSLENAIDKIRGLIK